MKKEEQKNAGTSVCASSWRDLMAVFANTSKAEFDQNHVTCFEAVSKISNLLSSKQRLLGELTNEELRDVFYVSPCLGFLLWQHLSAFERLSHIQAQSEAKVKAIVEGLKGTIGLGVTHLAKTESTLIATNSDNKTTVTGNIPWASGILFFDSFLIGYVHGQDVVLSLQPTQTLLNHSGTKMTPWNLDVYQGTNSCQLTLDDYPIDDSTILSVTKKGTPSKGYASRFVHPETGFIRSILDECVRLSAEGLRPLKESIQDRMQKLESVVPGSIDDDQLEEKHQLAFAAARGLILAGGGKGMAKDSPVSVMFNQVRLFDCFVQSRELKQKKVESLYTE